MWVVRTLAVVIQADDEEAVPASTHLCVATVPLRTGSGAVVRTQDLLLPKQKCCHVVCLSLRHSYTSLQVALHGAVGGWD